jgi:predicted TIM-barrel fold metal-dependent hydrolase
MLAMAQEARPPIIDMHLHAQDLWADPGQDAGETFGPVFGQRSLGLPAANSTEDLQRQTLRAMDEYNVVVAVASGPHATGYQSEKPLRILASPLLSGVDVSVDSLREAYESGKYQALAEFMPQYSGLAPNAAELDPYFALVEELDIPLGLHVGLGPPGAATAGSPKFRMMHGNPLLLEEVLVRYPKLRLYVMHAGWPLLDEMVALLHAFPEVYIDISVINWYLPRSEFYAYLQRLVDAGYSKLIMYGSDQMVWPGAIGRSIETVESAPFLTAGQRRDIMCRNAAVFLRLDQTVCQ